MHCRIAPKKILWCGCGRGADRPPQIPLRAKRLAPGPLQVAACSFTPCDWPSRAPCPPHRPSPPTRTRGAAPPLRGPLRGDGRRRAPRRGRQRHREPRRHRGRQRRRPRRVGGVGRGVALRATLSCGFFGLFLFFCCGQGAHAVAAGSASRRWLLPFLRWCHLNGNGVSRLAPSSASPPAAFARSSSLSTHAQTSCRFSFRGRRALVEATPAPRPPPPAA